MRLRTVPRNRGRRLTLGDETTGRRSVALQKMRVGKFDKKPLRARHKDAALEIERVER
ncbi:hypothetical protein [Actinomadura coerulea]|uniref:hypothetical protein n=1 Tax=Actinomadura coerulea TaxID=46159 RepID=UPI003433AD06